MAKQQKGWQDARDVQRRARQAARRLEIANARKGKGNAPEYRETSTTGGCSLMLWAVLVAWVILLWRAVVRHSWGWSRG